MTYGELARLVVDADVGDVHGVGRRRDGRAARRAHEVAHEAREGALLLAAARVALLGGIALVAVAVAAWALGARWRGIHLAGERRERGRLAESRRAVLGLVGVRVLQKARTASGFGLGVERLLDHGGVEGREGRGRQVRERRRGCRGLLVVDVGIGGRLLVHGRQQ